MARKPSASGAPRGLSLAREIRVVLSTAPPRAARLLARRLVAEGFAACVNVVPGVASVYRWHGRVRSARESLLVIKVSRRRLKALVGALVAIHPYEVPEALVVAPLSGLSSYVRWVQDPM